MASPISLTILWSFESEFPTKTTLKFLLASYTYVNSNYFHLVDTLTTLITYMNTYCTIKQESLANLLILNIWQKKFGE